MLKEEAKRLHEIFDNFLCLFTSMVPNESTRSKAAGKIEMPAPNTKNLAVWNMASAWNAIPDLRVAKSEGKA